MQGVPPVKSLLLVDDSRDYCLHVERAFHQVQPGISVFPLADGQRAIEHLALCGERYPMPDLVLLDRHLPRGGPDGHAVLRAVRTLAHLQSLPILVVSGSDAEEHVVAAREAGASGYLIKPCVQGEYPQLARQVLAWWAREKSWSQPGPLPGQTGLALLQGALGSSPAMALSSEVGTLFSPVPAEQSLLQKVVSFVDWCRDTAEASLDPFARALHQACRAHKITPAQFMRAGGSQQLGRNRRAVLVDLIRLGWPDETLLEVVHVSATEMKRLRKAAREKVGPKLDRWLD